MKSQQREAAEKAFQRYWLDAGNIDRASAGLVRNRATDVSRTAKALKEVFEKRLYRETHDGFYLYCAERFGLHPDRVDWLIAVASGWPSTKPPKKQKPKEARRVYFILGGNKIKIGFTSDLRRRLETLQLGSPVRLEIIGSIEGSREDEQIWHIQFDHLREHGEWFRAEPELIEAIQEVLG